MSRCLCCGKALRGANLRQWHTSCIKSFFGTSELPVPDISKEQLHQLVLDSTGKGYTVPGVQKKLSLHLSRDGNTPRLTLVNYPTGYILKPQTEEYAALPEMEHLVMQMAEATGIKTVPHALLPMASQEGTFAYITKRIDRIDGKMLAMEDFCQLEERLTEDKYRGSYERCGKVIAKYSSAVGFDLTELFLRIVFSYAVGNSDMHLKNFSLIETEEGSCTYVLSAAYDLLSTNVVIPSDQEELALTLNGKKQNIHRKDFIIFANTIGLPEASAKKMIEKVVKLKDKYLTMCRDSYMPENRKEQLESLIKKRIAVLEK